ncbi:DNA translocase FtsK [Prosthecomicrobium hirschii]|uniref:DNA translocase FtsK n=2 Tax=Prosthecodimorpha hirschii TaxID=665126 RepID=UPI0022203F9A|nr:DNA translocase FtsK 4TM domain-containing protein [Prosthecomicrobium hirschii]MCW1842136.1 DNA translocase FtsK 4TM domain-containing protein [Prosthecomicrobium hirschii]
MRSSRTEASLPMDTDLRQIVTRNLAGLLGIGVLAVTGAVAVALASWSVTDPSYSNATQAVPRNLLGRPGAIVADLTFQLIGLAATVALLPALGLGWRLLSRGHAAVTRNRALAWLGGTVLTAAALAGLPVSQSWPLPVGLGGVIGDMIMKLPVWLTGATELGRFIGLALFGLGAIVLNAQAIGWGGRERAPVRASAARGRAQDQAFDDEDEDDAPRFMPLAMLHHWALVTRANLLRMVGRRGATLDNRGFSLARLFGRRRAPDRYPEDDFEDDYRPAPTRSHQRVEPGFQSEAPVSRVRVSTPRAPVEPEPYCDDEDDDRFEPHGRGREPEPMAPARALRRGDDGRVDDGRVAERRPVDGRASDPRGHDGRGGPEPRASEARAGQGRAAPEPRGYDPDDRDADYRAHVADRHADRPPFDLDDEEEAFDDEPLPPPPPPAPVRVASPPSRGPASRIGAAAEPRGGREAPAREAPARETLAREAPAPEPAPRDKAAREPAEPPTRDPNERRVPVGQMHGPMAQVKKPAREAEGRGFLGFGDGYQFPPITLLSEPRRLGPAAELSEEVLEGNAGVLEGVLDDFGVKGEIIHVRPGPVVTMYELEPAPGVKSSRVIGLADDIARSMSAVSARVAVVPGRNVIGIELPNQRRETVYLREMIASENFETTKHKLALCLGKTIGGEPVIADLARMPHLLVAGTTGSGKSVAINTMILSLLYRLKPEQCKLIMIDPKMLELSVYDGIPHLLSPVVTDPKKAVMALKWTVREMEDRYRKMSKLGVRNIDGFNARVAEAKARGEILTREVQTGFHRQTGEPIYEQEQLALDPLPYIVVVVDEMADLMIVAGKEIEGAIQRLAQMARAAGIHIVMATQRPSVDVITGTIKANFPTRISFQVTSKIDSRTILGEQGAEQLLGQGDMLFMEGGGRIKRVHGPFVADDEVEKVVHHLKRQGTPQYLDAITAGDDDAEDEDGGDASGLEESADLYDRAVAVVMKDKKASTSYVQRRLQIGYNRAASLIERMEKEGIVGPANHAGKREILIGSHDD